MEYLHYNKKSTVDWAIDGFVDLDGGQETTYKHSCGAVVDMTCEKLPSYTVDFTTDSTRASQLVNEQSLQPNFNGYFFNQGDEIFDGTINGGDISDHPYLEWIEPYYHRDTYQNESFEVLDFLPVYSFPSETHFISPLSTVLSPPLSPPSTINSSPRGFTPDASFDPDQLFTSSSDSLLLTPYHLPAYSAVQPIADGDLNNACLTLNDPNHADISSLESLSSSLLPLREQIASPIPIGPLKQLPIYSSPALADPSSSQLPQGSGVFPTEEPMCQPPCARSLSPLPPWDHSTRVHTSKKIISKAIRRQPTRRTILNRSISIDLEDFTSDHGDSDCIDDTSDDTYKPTACKQRATPKRGASASMKSGTMKRSGKKRKARTSPLRCPDCFETFTRSADCKRHIKHGHVELTDEQIYAITSETERIWCTGCRKKLSRADARRRHEKTCGSFSAL